MPLSQFTNNKFVTSLKLFLVDGLDFTQSVEYQKSPQSFFSPTEFMALADVLVARLPDNTVRFDIELSRGGWGAQWQNRMGRKQIRLILPFQWLGWTGSRRYLAKKDIGNLIGLITDKIILPSRFTENERTDFIAVLSNTDAIWCLDAGDLFASMYAALAHEQAWEKAYRQPDELVTWWRGLTDQDKIDITESIKQLWLNTAMDEVSVSREFYAIATARNSRWGETALLNVAWPSNLIKLAGDNIFQPIGLTRPKFDLTSATIIKAFNETANNDFGKAVEDSLNWLGHLTTGPKSLSLFGADNWQLAEMIKKFFVATRNELTLANFKTRLIAEHKLTGNVKTELKALVDSVDITEIVARNNPQPVLSPAIRWQLFNPFVLPADLSEMLYKLSYLSDDQLERAGNLLQNYIISLKRLWYLWYALIEGMRQSLSDFWWVNKIAAATPLWDLRPDKALLYIQNYIENFVAKKISLPDEIRIIIDGSIWLLRHDDELTPSCSYPEDYFVSCAVALEKSSVIISGTQQRVKDLLMNYRSYNSSQSHDALNRLKFIQSLNVSSTVRDKYLQILDWYDNLQLLQEYYNEAKIVWQDIFNSIEQKYIPGVDSKTPTDALGLAKPLPSPDGAELAVPLNQVLIIPTSRPTALKSPEPAFFFDINDEEEADKFRPATSSSFLATSLESNLRKLAEEVIKQNNFKFKDEISKRRFANIFVSFMKDVRDQVDAREVMLKSQEAGGLGLTSDKVETVIKIFNQVKQTLPEKIKQWSELGKKPAPSQIISPPEKKEPAPPPPPKAEVKPPVSDQETEQVRVAAWRQEMLEQIAQMSSAAVPEKKVAVKPKLVDVKAPPRVFGPLEELKEMNLVDFRRLGPTANEVVNKILAKIQLIGETGIGRKYQAIRAWQASRVYRLYVNLGRESIEQAKPVTEIISQHQSQDTETLTVAEFEAIVDLNKKLRF